MNALEMTEKRLLDIEKWEKAFFHVEKNEWQSSYFDWYEKVMKQLNDRQKKKVYDKIDKFLFRFQSSYVHSKTFDDWTKRVIQSARFLNKNVYTIDDLQTLPLEGADFLAEQFMAKQRLLSLGQGGVTGLGGVLFLASDLPALLFIQIQSLQKLALLYGYDPRQPDEMLNTLKLLHIATLPKQYQRPFWEELCNEAFLSNNIGYGEIEIFDEPSSQWIIKQIAKCFVISMLRKKVVQGIPFLGIVISAGINYQFSKQVIEIGQRFYQKRRLLQT